MEKETGEQQTNSSLEHYLGNYSQAIQDDEADIEIYAERNLNNGQLHDPSGNHQLGASVLSEAQRIGRFIQAIQDDEADIAIQDDESNTEIYSERNLNNGQLHDPSGNHQSSASVLFDQTNNNASQANRGIKRQHCSHSTIYHFQQCEDYPEFLPRKILCLLVEVDDIQDLEDLEDSKDPEEPKEEGNKLSEDLDLPGRDF